MWLGFLGLPFTSTRRWTNVPRTSQLSFRRRCFSQWVSYTVPQAVGARQVLRQVLNSTELHFRSSCCADGSVPRKSPFGRRRRHTFRGPRKAVLGGRQWLSRRSGRGFSVCSAVIAAMTSYTPYLVLLCGAVGLARAAKIVIVPPIMFESHMYIFRTLAEALHERGHRTVFLLSEGRDLAPSPSYGLHRYPGVFNSSSSDAFLQAKMHSIFSGRPTVLELLDILDHYARNCDMMLANHGLVSALLRERFDLLLVDPNDMCGFVMAHVLGVQYAVFSTGLWYPAEVGAPAPLAYVPEFNSLLTDRMSLLQRMKNAGVYLVSRLGVSLLVLPRYEHIMRKHRLLPATSMPDLVQGSSLWMLCTDVALEFPRPTLPNVVYVGGILTKPAGPLPQVGDGRGRGVAAAVGGGIEEYPPLPPFLPTCVPSHPAYVPLPVSRGWPVVVFVGVGHGT